MKLWITFLRDLKVSYRTFYVYIEFVMALLVVAVLLFVVPETSNAKIPFFLHLGPGVSQEMVLDSMGKNEETEITLVDSREAVVEALEKDRSAQGAEILLTGQTLGYELILQGYEGDKVKNMLQSALEEGLKTALPGYEDVTVVEVLEPNSERLPGRISFLPMYLLLNSSFMGLFIVAAYVFMDKEEGTIKALTVTPVTVKDYLLAKVLVMLFTGLLTGLLVTGLVAGGKPHYGYLLLLLIVTNLFGTALGLYIASFYDSIIKSMGALYIVIMVLAFAGVSYYMPSFTPLIIRILPSYPMLFAFREAFLNEPHGAYILQTSGFFFILSVGIFFLAAQRYKKTLTI